MSARHTEGQQVEQEYELEEIRDERPQGAYSSEEEDEDEVELIMVLAPLDPPRMTLSGEECDWATDIKAAIAATPGLDEVSDFMCVQLALKAKGDVGSGVDCAIRLQAFREEYGIKDTVEDGRRRLCDLFQLLPRHVLDFGQRPDGTYFFLVDLAQFDGAAKLTNEDKMKAYLGGCYYLYHACCPDIEAMRQGFIALIECQGMSFARKKDLKVVQKMVSELLCSYPIRGKVKHFHTSSFFNVMSSMFQRIVGRDAGLQFQTCCVIDIEARPLGSMYLVPTVESANQRVLGRMHEVLQLRYREENAFSLDPID